MLNMLWRQYTQTCCPSTCPNWCCYHSFCKHNRTKHSVVCRLLEHSLSVTPFLRYDLQGKLVGKTEDRIAEMESLYKKFGKKICLLGWHEIRQLLFEYLPGDVVEFDKQVRHRLTSTLLSISAVKTGCLPQCPSAPLAANFPQEGVQCTMLSLQNALHICSGHSRGQACSAAHCWRCCCCQQCCLLGHCCPVLASMLQQITMLATATLPVAAAAVRKKLKTHSLLIGIQYQPTLLAGSAHYLSMLRSRRLA